MELSERRQHHFEVEKELAAKLRNSTREQRKTLAPQLYSELYRRVPEHPRIARSKDAAAAARTIAAQMRLVDFALRPDTEFLEFGAGSGAFSREVARKVARSTALEVCSQSETTEGVPENYRMLLHDGQLIPLPDGSTDVAFSYQVLEHLHPDDIDLHLGEMHRVLRPGGVYILSTPHDLSGPHDISRYFGRKLKTFHLKEWTYTELSSLMRRAGFTKVYPYFRGQTGSRFRLLLPCLKLTELALSVLPQRASTWVARKFLNNVVVCAVK